MGRNKSKQKITLPPELPPDLADDDVEVSDEDVQFLNANVDYAGFVSRLDTQSITKHVTRVADVKEDALEALYEKRMKKKSLQKEKELETLIQVDPVDALPIKTADGKLHYRTVPKKPKASEDEDIEDEKDEGANDGIVKLSKAERRAKLKKSRKDAKKQGKELATAEEVEQTPQAAVLAEVKEDLTAEEVFESKKHKLAELGMALLSDPESNIKSLKEILDLSKDQNHAIVKLGMLSLLAVFKDIIPGYRIRLPTEKEMEMKISKDVKKMRFYESTLLSAYKAYLQKLIALEKQPLFQHVAIRCICSLLEAVPHFNFRESLLGVVVRNIGSLDDVVRKLCCTTIKSLFTYEGKHGGEATVEAVRLIADHVKFHSCQLHPESIEVFMSLYFDEHIGKPEQPDKNDKCKFRKNRKRKNVEEPNQPQENKGKKNKKEMMTKMREEVAADFKAVAFTPDVMERRKMQSETLSAVFETYFRILKNTLYLLTPKSEVNGTSSTVTSEAHPLLAPCLDGLGKFSHLIDMDFMSDLINHLRKLASGCDDRDSSEKSPAHLTVSERLRCCIVAFKVMKNNLDALNVDLQEFFIQLYNIILEYRPGRDQGEVLAEALKLMLCDDRQRDMQKTAAFVKRLATFSLCFGSAEAMAALVTLKNLLQKNIKCRNLLENDAGGGSVSGSINAKYQPFASDPNLSGSLASVLWELNLLSKHYHPSVSTMSSGITGMSSAENLVLHSTFSPLQAFKDLSIEKESFAPSGDIRKLNSKRKRGSKFSISAPTEPDMDTNLTEDEVKKKLSEHFTLVRDIKENETLRAELDRVRRSVELYEEYRKQKMMQKAPKPKKLRK